jgi:hypothetical protein
VTAIPWPQNSPRIWNTCVLGGKTLPGLCRVQISLAVKLDVKDPAGGAAAGMTYQGEPPAKVGITCRVWTPEQWVLLQQVLPALRVRVARKAGAAEPLQIVHPKATLWGIRAVSIQNIVDDNGGDRWGDVYELKFDCLEWAPLPKVPQSVTKTATKALGDQQNAIATVQGATPPSKSGASKP